MNLPDDVAEYLASHPNGAVVLTEAVRAQMNRGATTRAMLRAVGFTITEEGVAEWRDKRRPPTEERKAECRRWLAEMQAGRRPVRNPQDASAAPGSWSGSRSRPEQAAASIRVALNRLAIGSAPPRLAAGHRALPPGPTGQPSAEHRDTHLDAGMLDRPAASSRRRRQRRRRAACHTAWAVLDD